MPDLAQNLTARRFKAVGLEGIQFGILCRPRESVDDVKHRTSLFLEIGLPYYLRFRLGQTEPLAERLDIPTDCNLFASLEMIELDTRTMKAVRLCTID